MSHQVEIKQIIQNLLPEWKEINTNDILLERMTGITNETYKASAPNSKLLPIIFRKFGESTENIFLERQSEIYVYLHLSEIGLGPKVFYFDEDIRLEEFIESSVLPAKKMLSQGYLEEVAFALSKFHQLKPPSEKIKKQSLIRRVFIDGAEKILGVIHNKMNKDIFSPEEKELGKFFKEWVTQQEINFLDQITKLHEEDGLVFSHNDLLANNVLIQKDTNNTIFIDYEYACYNYPIYDIANYISESLFNYEFPQPPYFQFTPSKPEDFEKQVRFIEAYVVAKDLSLSEFRANFETLRKEEKYHQEVKKLVNLLPFGRMLCNLVWGWWGFIVCKNPQIQFDYLAFSKKRYEEYQKYRKEATS